MGLSETEFSALLNMVQVVLLGFLTAKYHTQQRVVEDIKAQVQKNGNGGK